MVTFKAKVTQDIPANRLIGLGGIDTEGNQEEGWETIYLKLSEKGWIPDFVSTSNLTEGDTVSVTITDKPVWKVEASQRLPAGTLVQCDESGRVKSYNPNDGSHFGYTLQSVEEGNVVEVVRKYGYKPPASQVESMIYKEPSILEGTVSEVKNKLNKLNKEQLEKALEDEKGNKNRKSIIEHIESLLESD